MTGFETPGTRPDSVILAHCYQPGFIQDIADLVGDSFQLARAAAERPEKTILFAGVGFMAETAAILAPHKDVFLVSEGAGCPMAAMITPKQLIEFRNRYPGSPVMCYVNSTARIKALSDVCCTSSTAVAIAEKLATDHPILFVPDAHLGQFTAERSGRRIIPWNGFCNVHVRLKPGDVHRGRREHHDGIVMVHPECEGRVRDLADHVLSTGGMLALAAGITGRTFLVGTEIGLIHTLRRANPANSYVPLSMELVCPNMKMSTMDDLEAVFSGGRTPVRVPECIAGPAGKALRRMLELAS